MLPRKRQRPNPGPPTTALSREVAIPQTVLGPPPLLRSHRSIAALSAGMVDKQLRKSRSWYGVWPRVPSKAMASTSVARENILAATLRSSRPPDLGRLEDLTAGEETACQRESVTMDDENGSKTRSRDEDQPGTQSEDAHVPSPPTNQAPSHPLRSAASYSWLGWWSGTPMSETPDQSSTGAGAASSQSDNANPPERRQSEQQTAEKRAETCPGPESSSSTWFGLWPIYRDMNTTTTTTTTTTTAEDATTTDEPSPAPSLPDSRPEAAPKAGSTWAFWSRDSTTGTGALSQGAGQVAVMGEASESHPHPMTAVVVSDENTKSTWRRSKRARPPSPALSDAAVTEAPTIPSPANVVLPCFNTTYSVKEKPSMLRQLADWLLLRPQTCPTRHVQRLSERRRIRKAVAIGVHGLIPAAYLRPMLGQPTGTSLRLASLCGDAIRRWAGDECEVQTIALEGEGRIGDRVDSLWRLLLNWMDALRRADCLVMAAHSQGVPVAIMLLQRLMDFGILSPDARIGVCAMAGVTLGPFSDLRSGLLPSAATELWELADPQSSISRKLQTSISRVLESGGRISFIASLDDQLVPLDSALYTPASHPYLYRAVFIDSRLQSPAPDFIALLVALALKLRNLGRDDDGLLHQLARPLAGPLYTGDGHSRLYYDAAVYDVAVAHALETDDVPVAVPCRLRGCDATAIDAATTATDAAAAGTAVVAGVNQNPYVLPWIMRGILDDASLAGDVAEDSLHLLRQFDEWRPATKALKDVKYRLEAVRSKL
ncbi:hypothetical protein XA68_17329 [Ophiocordyceps unilateralis]|uniref:YMC020W-like alpha/beta hydrolase domain-containing protein n=1 Tax=Ophiocordyceps unilateralis TaxID=268505 RepID=A0A2A9P462_OPHUN|nr:hypothetical protein XA68_17329 [Ophiocordyceps unilateralis]